MRFFQKSVQNDADIRKLDDSQLESFDTDYVEGDRWDTITSRDARRSTTGQLGSVDSIGGVGPAARNDLLRRPRSAVGRQ